MADKDEQLPHKNKKRTTKSCLNCGFENPVAKKSCHSCGNPYPKRQKDWDKIYNMGATNITKQREIMEFRVSNIPVNNEP
ncbi:hypothetical protein AC249_AIPGENE8717 [Exaiptasia diaphana]|nr:hypothetical protein AC249_AIPGENE8717 [Exaiptasia diaphana]